MVAMACILAILGGFVAWERFPSGGPSRATTPIDSARGQGGSPGIEGPLDGALRESPNVTGRGRQQAESTALLRGVVEFVDGAPAVGRDGELRVVLARPSTMSVDATVDGSSASFVEFEIDRSTGVASPVALRGEEVVCDGRTWEVPVPPEPLIVSAVYSGEVELLIESGRKISAGARDHTVQVSQRPNGRILLLGVDGGDVAATVGWTHEIPLGQQISVRVTGESAPAEVADRPTRADSIPLELGGAPMPSHARGVVTSLGSVIDYPIASFDRRVWVTVEGYLPTSFLWPGGQSDVSVEVSRPASVGISLDNPSDLHGEYDVGLTEDSGFGDVHASWARVRPPTVLRSAAVPDGRQTLLVTQRTPFGDRVVFSEPVDVEPGKRNRFSVDLGGSEEELGSLTVLLDLPSSPPVDAGQVHLLVDVDDYRYQPFLSAGRSRAYSLDFDSGRYVGEYGEVLAGIYSIGVAPFGLVEQVEVDPGGSTVVDVELPEVVHVEVEFVDASGEVVGEGRELSLEWESGRSSPSAASVLRRSRAVSQSFGSGSLRSLFAPPGQLTLFVRDGSGALLAIERDVDVFHGMGTVQVEVAGSGFSAATVVLLGSPATASPIVRALVESPTGVTTDTPLVSRSVELHIEGGRAVGLAIKLEGSRPGEAWIDWSILGAEMGWEEDTTKNWARLFEFDEEATTEVIHWPGD